MSGTPIALLTDYGTSDAYVGVLRAVIQEIWPWATILDLCHEVPPQNIMSGAWMLAAACPWLTQDSIVCAVVDPGVGSSRRAVAVETEYLRLVAPDNGLLSLLLAQDPALRAVELDRERWFLRHRCATFDGRDVFAPVAAQLARGVRFEALGSAIDPASLQTLDLPVADYSGETLAARVLHIDRFGNAITTVRAPELVSWRGSATLRVTAAGTHFPFVRTFSDVGVGQPLSYFGSAGNLELAVRGGNCGDIHDLVQGDFVELRRVTSE